MADGLMVARRRGYVRGALCALTLLGCSAEKEHPAPYTVQGKSPENPRSCRDIQRGTSVGTEIWLEDQRAACVAAGLVCPLGPDFSLGESCNPGAASAHCVGEHWILHCIDGGAP